MGTNFTQPIISPNIRVRYPDLMLVGEGSIVDDYCYFSTQIRIGRYTHIANGCSIGGGKAQLFQIGDFSSLSAGVRIWCASDDFVADLVAIPPQGMPDFKAGFITGGVTLGHYTAVGSNSVVMPDNTIPEGAVIGALSYVPPRYSFKPWHVYAGTPIRPVGERNRANVLSQVGKIEEWLSKNASARKE